MANEGKLPFSRTTWNLNIFFLICALCRVCVCMCVRYSTRINCYTSHWNGGNIWFNIYCSGCRAMRVAENVTQEKWIDHWCHQERVKCFNYDLMMPLYMYSNCNRGPFISTIIYCIWADGNGLCSRAMLDHSLLEFFFFWFPLLIIVIIKLLTNEQTKCRIHMSAGSSAVKDFQIYLFLFFRICSNYQMHCIHRLLWYLTPLEKCATYALSYATMPHT